MTVHGIGGSRRYRTPVRLLCGIGLLLAVTGCQPGTPPSSLSSSDGVALYPGVAEGPPVDLLPAGAYTAQWEKVGDATTFGIQLCARGGRSLAVDSVSPAGTDGTGFRITEARVVRFRRSDGATLASDGYPPKRAGETVIPFGSTGIEPCSSTDEWATELQVVLEATSDDGGGWNGVLLHFSGDSTGELRVGFGLFLCGRSTSPCHREG